MANQLMLYSGSPRVTREELINVPTPKSTPTWKPIPHYEVANLIMDQAESRGMAVLSEEYGLNPAGTKMFGVLRFHPNGHPEYARALGVRNSHDKSLALGLTVGVSICVCENLAFGGDVVIHRKHTSGIEVEALVPQAFDNLAPQYDRLETNIERLKNHNVSLNEARSFVVKAAEADAIPSCDILTVLHEFRKPRHEEFSSRNRWSLLNAFTEIAKKYSPARSDKCHRGLTNLFSLN